MKRRSTSSLIGGVVFCIALIGVLYPGACLAQQTPTCVPNPIEASPPTAEDPQHLGNGFWAHHTILWKVKASQTEVCCDADGKKTPVDISKWLTYSWQLQYKNPDIGMPEYTDFADVPPGHPHDSGKEAFWSWNTLDYVAQPVYSPCDWPGFYRVVLTITSTDPATSATTSKTVTSDAIELKAPLITNFHMASKPIDMGNGLLHFDYAYDSSCAGADLHQKPPKKHLDHLDFVAFREVVTYEDQKKAKKKDDPQDSDGYFLDADGHRVHDESHSGANDFQLEPENPTQGGFLVNTTGIIVDDHSRPDIDNKKLKKSLCLAEQKYQQAYRYPFLPFFLDFVSDDWPTKSPPVPKWYDWVPVLPGKWPITRTLVNTAAAGQPVHWVYTVTKQGGKAVLVILPSP